MGQSKEKRTLLTNEQIRALIEATRRPNVGECFDTHEEAARHGYITARYIQDVHGLCTSQSRFLRRAMTEKHAESAIIVCGTKCKAADVNASPAE
jgi:hypothetical protein